MATALLDYQKEQSLLSAVHSDLLSFARELESSYLTLSRHEATTTLVDVEKISKVVDHLQVLAARAAEDHELATAGQPEPYRSTSEYLRAGGNSDLRCGPASTERCLLPAVGQYGGPPDTAGNRVR
jgi:hypothetical protein